MAAPARLRFGEAELRRRERRLGWLLSGVVGAAAFLAFWPALSAGFSDFDDHGFLIEVDGWRGLAPRNIAWIFSTMRLGHYQPLTYLSYALEYELFGLDARAYHATNMLLHAANAVMLMWLCVRLCGIAATGASGTALRLAGAAAALLWALHPMRVESVAWITERRDVLSAAFLLGAVLAYLRSVEPGRGARWPARACTGSRRGSWRSPCWPRPGGSRSSRCCSCLTGGHCGASTRGLFAGARRGP